LRQGPDDLGEDFDWIGPEPPDDQQKLHDIDPPPSAFKRGYHRLRLTEPPRQLDLRKIRPTPCSRQSRADDLIVLVMHPFRGGSHWNASGMMVKSENLISDNLIICYS
jgi:hypothetical protein